MLVTENWQRIDVNKYNKDGDDQWFSRRGVLSRLRFYVSFYVHFADEDYLISATVAVTSKHAVLSEGTIYFQDPR